jgi:RNA recognition motif-containing protein
MDIHVTNLSQSVIAEDLKKLFSAYGSVGFVVIARDTKKGRSLGIAFIEMPNASQAQQAVMALHNMKLDGMSICVKEIEYRAGEFNN